MLRASRRTLSTSSTSNVCTALLRQNNILRESIGMEFGGLSSSSDLPSYDKAMREYHATLLAAADHNDAALATILGPPAVPPALERVADWFGFGGRHKVYDGLGSLWRHCAKDWSAEGAQGIAPLREHLSALVAAEHARQLGRDSDVPLNVLVAGCGQARLAWTLAQLAEPTQVTGVDASEATLAFARHVLGRTEPHSLTFHPWLDAFANNHDVDSRAALCSVPDVAPGVGSSSNLTLEQADFMAYAARAPAAHVCVTAFFLDCVDDLPAALAAVRDVLVPGGAWIFAGPLHYHQGPQYEPKPHPPLSHLLRLAADVGFVVEEEPVLLPAPYVPRPRAFLHEADWRVPCFVAKRERERD
jgi:SAM-dependent methyltransferase